MAVAWKPELHPRGHHGKFARKGTASRAFAAVKQASHSAPSPAGPIDHPELSPQERRAVNDYTGSGYSVLNQYVQAGDKLPGWITDEAYRKQITDHAAALRTAIDRSVIRQPLTVRRRIPTHIADNVFGTVGSHVGHTFTEQRFTSTTLADDVSRGEFGPVLLRYSLKRGTKALDVNHVGNGKASEHELILGPGHRYRVTDDRMVRGQREIGLEAQ